MDTSISSWEWDFGDGNTSNSSIGTHSYQDSGFYQVRLIVEDKNNCKDTTFRTVEVKPKPSNFSLGDDLEHCFDDAPFSIDAGVWSSYIWQDSLNTQTYSANTEGIYSVTVFDNLGCQISDEIQISEFCPDKLEMSNVFTPNGDDVNDFFEYRHDHIVEFEIVIYNRWGIELFKTNDINNFWDGRTSSSGGGLVSDGVYFWIAKYADKKKNSFTQKGYLNMFQN